MYLLFTVSQQSHSLLAGRAHARFSSSIHLADAMPSHLSLTFNDMLSYTQSTPRTRNKRYRTLLTYLTGPSTRQRNSLTGIRL
jgi:hypothetical protein